MSNGDNPAGTGTRGITADALKKSVWLKGPFFLKTKDWTFKAPSDVLTNIRLKDSKDLHII